MNPSESSWRQCCSAVILASVLAFAPSSNAAAQTKAITWFRVADTLPAEGEHLLVVAFERALDFAIEDVSGSHGDSAKVSPPRYYCLALGYDRGAPNPPPEVIPQLTRLAPIRPATECSYPEKMWMPGIGSDAMGDNAVLVWVGFFAQPEKGKYLVTTGYFMRPLLGGGQVCEVALVNRRWVIQSCRVNWMT